MSFLQTLPFFSKISENCSFQPKNTPEEKLHLLRLARVPQVGPLSYFHLLNRYGDPQEVIDRLPFLMTRKKFPIPTIQDAKKELENHEKQGFSLVGFYEENYPLALRHLKDPPPFLTLKGQLSLLKKTLFAIVGSRNASLPGRNLAEIVSQDLSRQEWGIVSGLAKGIDAAVHQGALKGGTIAVMAGGLNNIYPLENKELYKIIGEDGLLLSEDGLHQGYHPSLFPKRNRLISGLSWGVLIIEASLNSGSLLTARYAAEQGKTVFAIPGHPLDFRSRGTNKLLKDGAFLVEDASDILEEYAMNFASMNEFHGKEGPWNFSINPTKGHNKDHDMSKENVKNSPHESPEVLSDDLYNTIYNALTMVPISIDALGQMLSLETSLLRSLLVMMEISGDVQFYPGDSVLRLTENQEK